MHPSTPNSVPGLPLVVQLGFAGSRFLFDAKAHPDIDAADFNRLVQAHLQQCLSNLPEQLNLSDKHFFCGLSQLAVGGDTLFSQACRDLKWPQRLLLPQQRSDFLAACGDSGSPDFSEAQRAEAEALFASPHIIDEHVACHDPDRRTRFHVVNLELADQADVLVCLLNAAASVNKTGGTHELMVDAEKRQRPLLEIRVAVGGDGKPMFEQHWHHRNHFTKPALPHEFDALPSGLTRHCTAAEFCGALKKFASEVSGKRQGIFKISAQIIVATHVLATMLAVIWHGYAWLLLVELLLLAFGFFTHQYLHRSHPTHVWAMARLVAEIARSVLALQKTPGHLQYLFQLPFPAKLRCLLRTLDVLHLRDTRNLSQAEWQDDRNNYVNSRLDGQISYYRAQLGKANTGYALAKRTFLAGSLGAMLAIVLELLSLNGLPPHCLLHALEPVLGPMTIILPVIAVAALSMSAALDLEARIHTYAEMLAFLKRQKKHLLEAHTAHAFSRRAMATESHLLAETAGWYSRRAFTGVA